MNILARKDINYTWISGVSKNGETTTIGRGGSDATAVAIAKIFKQKLVILMLTEYIQPILIKYQ